DWSSDVCSSDLTAADSKLLDGMRAASGDHLATGGESFEQYCAETLESRGEYQRPCLIEPRADAGHRTRQAHTVRKPEALHLLPKPQFFRPGPNDDQTRAGVLQSRESVDQHIEALLGYQSPCGDQRPASGRYR